MENFFVSDMDDDADGEKQNRVLLRPWLENMLENRCIPGLEWFDEDKTMFKVPWKHRSKKDWSMRHSSVFLEWAKNTGRWSEGDPAPNFAQLKTRLRCAFNKAPDIDEMKEHHYSKGEEPYKVYGFNTRRGEVKSVFGRKMCQKTAGKQGQRSRSPRVMKYESCEEEVIEDDYALYEEMEAHSTAPASKANMCGGAGQSMEESFQRNVIYSCSDNVMHVNTLFTTSGGWAYGCDGGSAESQNDLRDSKSPIIPLTVEMMMSANGDSDCDGDSPRKTWNHPIENSSGPVGNGVRAIKREGSSGKIHETETQQSSTPGADGSTDRMHLLQMASLFVEAAERQKQEDTVVEEMPMEHAASVESGESFAPAKHYVIIMPSSYGKEVENMEQMNEGNVTSGYVTPTGIEAIDLTVQAEDSNLSSKDNVTHLLELKVNSRIASADISNFGSHLLHLRDSTEISSSKQAVCEPEEAVDLTKPALLTKCAEMMERQTVSADLADEVKVSMCAAKIESKGNRDVEARKSHALLTENHTENEAYTSEDLKTGEYATFEQMSHLSIEQLAIKARQLYEWEKQLKAWEMQLQAKEETLYWRDRCLQSEMGTKAAAAYHISNEGVVWNKELAPPVHIASPSGAASSLPFTRFKPTTPSTANQPAANMPTTTPNLPGAIATRLFASHNLPVVTPNRPGATHPNRPVASPNPPSASPQLETGHPPVTGGSELKQRLAQMIIKSNRLPALRAEGGSPAARQCAEVTPTPLQPSTAVPLSVAGGAAVGSRPPVGRPLAAESYSVSAGSQQPIPLVSLIRPNQGVPMIVPVLGGSQQMLLVPRHLVPVAMAMQAQAAQSERRDVLKSHLETAYDGKSTMESHEIDSRKSEQKSLLGVETNGERDTKTSQSKRDDSSSEAEITTSVSSQEPRESSRSKHSATPNSKCSSSLTGMGSHSDADDQNDRQEVLESHSVTDLANRLKICEDDEITDEPTTTSKSNSRSRNMSEISTASELCEETSAENLSVLPSVSGNDGDRKSGKENEGLALSIMDVKLPESVQKQWAGHGSYLDFTKWLREKTETICKEESQEGRKSVECCGQVQLCSDSSSSKEKLENVSLIDIVPAASIKIVTSGASSANGGVPCSDSLVSIQGFENISPVASPNMPLVVEHENDFLEKGEDDEAFSATDSPLNNRKQTNLSGRRKHSCEKQNVLKKARVDC